MAPFSSHMQQPCEVLLHLLDDIIWTSPPPSGTQPSDDQTLSGVVEIECPSERVIPGIHVRLRGTQLVGFPPAHPTRGHEGMRWEEHIVLDRALALELEGVTADASAPPPPPKAASPGVRLEKGVHDFEFQFILPAWLPPYERCRYGRTRYMLTATALGAGRHNASVTATREAFVIQQHGPSGGPSPLEMHFQETHEALGFVSISLSSSSLTVGGTAALAVYHPKPPPKLNIHMYRVLVQQKFELHDTHTDTWTEMPPEKLRVWELGVLPVRVCAWAPACRDGVLVAEGMQPGRLGTAARTSPTVHALLPSLDVCAAPADSLPDAGDYGYRIKTVARLPDDNRLRPTTMSGTRTNVRVTHDIGVEVLFSRVDVLEERADNEMYGQPRVQMFSMLKTASIASCALTFDAVHLPPYSAASPVVSRPASPARAPRASNALRTATRTPPSGAGPSESDWNRLVHSLSSSLSATIRLPSSLSASRSASRAASRAASRPSTPPPADGAMTPGTTTPGAASAGPTTPTVHVLRPNDSAALLRRTSGAQPHSAMDRAAPRNLPVGTPWAVSHLPPRTGQNHDTCNCGQTTESLVEAEARLLEGAPTAPGAWIDEPSAQAYLPPWTPSSRASSPTHDWVAR
ncbi:hypothetical protein MSPP1_000449 [Malassezia sp. CBS 17886]|nr:hypothetical protein MSPP1_000449 [Malassezia sp. CBS 17886]